MLGPENAKQLLHKALCASRAEQTEAMLFAQDQALTRFANNQIHQNVAETDVTLTLRAVVGQRQGTATTNNLSDEGLARGKFEAFERYRALYPEYRYVFLDNRVPRGTFPKTIARGDRGAMVIYDPVAFIDIERYQKIDINAASPEAVYPSAAEMTVAANSGFLKECVRSSEIFFFYVEDHISARAGRNQ